MELKEIIKVGEEDLIAKQSVLPELEAKIEIGVKPAGSSQRLKSVISKLKEEQSMRHARIVSNEDFFLRKADLGHVLAASGYRYSPENHILDWALIKVGNSRAPGNSMVCTLYLQYILLSS
jgi:hypothetical protein